jgi:predicted nucleotidyltransferase
VSKHFQTAHLHLKPADAEGWEVLEAGLERAAAVLGKDLVAAYALGSLAHGGFSAATSDVDLALIVEVIHWRTERKLGKIRKEVSASLRSPLSSRLSWFWSTWHDLARQTGAGRFPLVDRIDLLEHGTCLLGVDRRAEVLLPAQDRIGRELVIEGARFMLEKLATKEHDELLRNPERLAASGCREVTKAVLFPARFLFTAATGRSTGNPEAVSHFASRPASPVRSLVVAAGRWRERGELDPPEQTTAQLSAGLLPLHRELTTTYANLLAQYDQSDLAAALAAWWARLGAT